MLEVSLTSASTAPVELAVVTLPYELVNESVYAWVNVRHRVCAQVKKRGINAAGYLKESRMAI